MVLAEKVRASFIWFDSSMELMEEPPPKAPMSFLGRDNTFAPQFDLAQSGKHPDGLQPPWEDLSRQLFWIYYLERVNPSSFHGAQAWRTLVPLRVKLESKFTVPGLPLAVSFTEGFFYPHGVGFGITVDLTERQPVDVVVNALIDLQQKHRLKLPNGKTTPLSGYAVHYLGQLRGRAFRGPSVPTLVPLDSPFSITTVIGADAAAAEPAILDQGPTHRILEALARWSSTWDKDSLPKLADRRLSKTKQNTSDADALYSSTRGRVVWFPSSFGKAGGPDQSCYHRNLFYAAVQVESLGSLCLLAAQKIAAHEPLSPSQWDCARQAARILGRLYGGSKTSYRTLSAKRHIEENRKQEINVIRSYKGLTPL
jgi:hypothetical protein